MRVCRLFAFTCVAVLSSPRGGVASAATLDDGQAACDLIAPLKPSPRCSLGKRLEACLAALPPSGGECDARTAPEPRIIDHVIRIEKRGTSVLLGAYHVRLEPNAEIDLRGSGSVLRGLGQMATFVDVRSGCGIHVGSTDAMIWRWSVEALTVAAASESATCGIVLTNAREGYLGNIQLMDFTAPSAAGLLVLDDSWANTTDRLYVTHNNVGMFFKGTNLNAWSIRGGYINKNAVGVLFDLGNGTEQGVTFGPGLVFENNTAAGIRVKSGHLLQITFLSPYVEAYTRQKFFEVRGENGIAVEVGNVFVDGGYIYSADVPPFLVDATGSQQDSANIVGSGLFLRASKEFPLMTLIGVRATATIVAPMVSLKAKKGTAVLSTSQNASGTILGAAK